MYIMGTCYKTLANLFDQINTKKAYMQLFYGLFQWVIIV